MGARVRPEQVRQTGQVEQLKQGSQASMITTVFRFLVPGRVLGRIVPRRAVRAQTVLATVAALALVSACSEREIILPGEREDIRPQGIGLTRDFAPEPEDSVSRPIRLPAQKVNAAWAQAPGTAANRTDHAALSGAPGLIWSVPIGAGDGRRVRITADPVVAQGRVYTLDSGARVSAVSTSGALVWSTDLRPVTDDEEEATGGGLAHHGGTLYVSTGFGRISALDAGTGAVKWTQRLEAVGSGTPLIHDGLVYLVAGDETGWALRASDGTVAWTLRAAPSVANVLGAPAPAMAGKFVGFAFGSGELSGVFRGGGLRRWSGVVGGKRVGRVASRIGDITGAPVVVGNRIYVGNHSGRTAALDRDTGKAIWTAPQGALGPVWPAGGSLFAVTDQSQLVRLDARDGTLVWARDLPGFTKAKPRKRGPVFAHYGPILAGGRLIVASNDGVLRLFAPEDGRVVGTVAVPGGATTAPVVAQRTLYVVSSDGKLHAFR